MGSKPYLFEPATGNEAGGYCLRVCVLLVKKTDSIFCQLSSSSRLSFMLIGLITNRTVNASLIFERHYAIL